MIFLMKFCTMRVMRVRALASCEPHNCRSNCSSTHFNIEATNAPQWSGTAWEKATHTRSVWETNGFKWIGSYSESKSSKKGKEYATNALHGEKPFTQLKSFPGWMNILAPYLAPVHHETCTGQDIAPNLFPKPCMYQHFVSKPCSFHHQTLQRATHCTKPFTKTLYQNLLLSTTKPTEGKI